MRSSVMQRQVRVMGCHICCELMRVCSVPWQRGTMEVPGTTMSSSRRALGLGCPLVSVCAQLQRRFLPSADAAGHWAKLHDSRGGLSTRL